MARRLPAIACAALLASGCGKPAATPDEGMAPLDAAALDAAIDLASPPDLFTVPGPTLLSQTGLYADFNSRTLSQGVIPYTPRYQLWSDGAEKARYLLLPSGAKIATSDMDNWTFPVGTRVWKQFSFGGKVVETRLLQKVYDSATGWFEVAYVWRLDGSDADATPAGLDNALGTFHHVPSLAECGKCHGNVRDVLIGVSALQLSQSDGKGTLSKLAAMGLLSNPPPIEFQPPGTGLVQDALGYLHGNCGHCHNDGSFFASKSVLRLRLGVSDVLAEQTPTYKTSINVKMYHDIDGTILGVEPGKPEASQLYYRMSLRNDYQMPTVCTQIADQAGLTTIGNWINSLPH